MDYRKHYDALIDKARKRYLDGYTEQHHVIPRCLGGTDDPENLVVLTPEEHYVAHQLLVKMHLGNEKLVYALSKMTQGRPSNKRYGWVRRRWAEVCKKRTGENNGSYGRQWYHDPETGEAGKFLDGEVPEGWVKGRTPKSKCEICNKIISKSAYRCKAHTNLLESDKFIANTRNQKKKSEGFYKSLWEKYTAGNYKSLKHFVDEECNIGYYGVRKGFEKYIEEYR